MIEKNKSNETVFNNEKIKNIVNNKIFQGIFIALLIILGLFMLKMLFSSFLSSKGLKGGTSSAVNGGGNNKIISASVGGGLRLFKPSKS